MTKQGRESKQIPKDLSAASLCTTVSAHKGQKSQRDPLHFCYPYSSDLGRDGVVSVVRAEQPTNREMIPRRRRIFLDLIQSSKPTLGLNSLLHDGH
jgi:hypothetical protein